MRTGKRFLTFFIVIVLLLQLSVIAYANDANEPHQVTITVVQSRAQSTLAQDSVLRLQSAGVDDVVLTLHMVEDSRAVCTANLNPATYNYSIETNDATYSGSFEVSDNTKEIFFRNVDFSKVIYDSSGFSIQLTHQDGRSFTCDSDTIKTAFYVPAYDGDSYYTYRIIPDDANKVAYTGHMYLYKGVQSGPFDMLNLSDGYLFVLWDREDFTIKAPKGMEVYWAQQARFYTCWDLQLLTKDVDRSNADPECDYYLFDRHTNEDSYLLLRQSGKISRFCDFKKSDYSTTYKFGDWNADKSELTLYPLKNGPYSLSSGDYPYDSNVLTNANASELLKLERGSYFDLVTLRTWQAVTSTMGNKYMDPEFHYMIMGDSVEVEKVNEYDVIQQFGRIRAKHSGVSCIVFTYDALEAPDENYGSIVHGALSPENTGVIVAAVNHSDTGIHTNIPS